MREEKKQICDEYVGRLQAAAYFIVVEYSGLKVSPFAELRARLNEVEGEVHVVKNSIFKIAVAQTGIEDLGTSLRGQLAVVSGEREITSAAKVLKNFAEEFEKPEMLFGFVGKDRLDAKAVQRIADLPPLEGLRANLVGLIQTPARQLAILLQTPARQLACVIKARSDQD